jgi:hypothetical protein
VVGRDIQKPENADAPAALLMATIAEGTSVFSMAVSRGNSRHQRSLPKPAVARTGAKPWVGFVGNLGIGVKGRDLDLKRQLWDSKIATAGQQLQGMASTFSTCWCR